MTDILPSTDETARLLGFELEPFEGMPVIAAGIEIPGAAGGLRDAMKVEPRAWHIGDRVFVLLECDVRDVRHPSVDKGDLNGPRRRVHVLDSLAGTVMEPDVAKPAIDAQRERIIKAREEALGIQQLDLDGAKDGGTPTAGTDEDGFVDASLVKAALRKLSKDDLRALLDANGILTGYTTKTTGDQLIELLVEGVPDLAEQLEKLNDADQG